MKFRALFFTVLWAVGLSLSCTPQPVYSQESWSGSAFFGFGHGWSVGTQFKRDTFHDFLGIKRLDIDFDAFIGSTLKDSTPCAAFELGKRWPLTSEQRLELYLGGGLGAYGSGNFSLKNPTVTLGLGVGLTYRF